MITQLKRALQRATRSGRTDRLLSSLSEQERKLITRIRAEKLTYLSERKLASIGATCTHLRDKGVAGVFIEAGCALGGSTILIASSKERERRLRVHDVFGMIPAPTAADTPDVHERYRDIVQGKAKGIEGDTYYGYRGDLYETVVSNLNRFGIELAPHNVALVRGLVQDTLQVDESVAFAHIDVDWYDPVLTCLTRIYPKLSVGGSIILDDYHDWGGCRKATDEFLRGWVGTFALDDAAGSMKVTRTRD